MNNINLLAIDIAKNIFQLHGNDNNGKCVYKKRVTRSNLAPIIASLPCCTIVMESCGGSSYWYRKFTQIGHTVKLIAPQYVKPFVKTNKNDANDAEAIAEAASRPSMRFVSPKNVQQQDIQCLHKIRKRLVKSKIQLSNQIRGLLLEYGVAINQTYASLQKALPEILENDETELTELTKELLLDLYSEFLDLSKKIKDYDKKILNLAKSHDSCKRIMKLEGIGEISATAIISTMGDPKQFKNGRHFAAYLGLVPKQNSSGQKQKLLGISKRGNTYLRTLLIHGARSVIVKSRGKEDNKSKWIQAKICRSGYARTVVALANKNARIVWSMLANNTEYCVNK